VVGFLGDLHRLLSPGDAFREFPDFGQGQNQEAA
jgi:hypothetical protein